MPNGSAAFRLARPGDGAVRAFLDAQRGAALAYREVGATRGALPAGYTVDHRRTPLGAGEDAWRRAVDALRAWRMTTLGWASVHPAGAPQRTGEDVAVVVRHYGFWSMHACRVVYALDDVTADATGHAVHRVGFAYGTLPAHAATGEERFLVEWRRADDSVWYDLLAFSRPRHPLARLGAPLARRQQRRFGRDSARAMAAAVAEVATRGVGA